MRGYGPTGVSYSYSRGNLISDLVEGILVCEEYFVEEEFFVRLPLWLAEEVADSLIRIGVEKGYTRSYVREKEGCNKPRLYVDAPRKEVGL